MVGRPVTICHVYCMTVCILMSLVIEKCMSSHVLMDSAISRLRQAIMGFGYSACVRTCVCRTPLYMYVWNKYSISLLVSLFDSHLFDMLIPRADIWVSSCCYNAWDFI